MGSVGCGRRITGSARAGTSRQVAPIGSTGKLSIDISSWRLAEICEGGNSTTGASTAQETTSGGIISAAVEVS